MLHSGSEGMRRGFMICGLAIAAEALLVGIVHFIAGTWDEETDTDMSTENHTFHDVC